MFDANLLLIGTVTSTSQNDVFLSAGLNPGPAEIVQRYLISGLINSELKSVEVVSAPRIPAFPKRSFRPQRLNSSVLKRKKLHPLFRK